MSGSDVSRLLAIGLPAHKQSAPTPASAHCEKLRGEKAQFIELLCVLPVYHMGKPKHSFTSTILIDPAYWLLLCSPKSFG